VGSEGNPDKVFVTKSCLTSHFTISGSEGGGESLYLDAGYDEVIQSQTTCASIVLGQQILHKCLGESVSHLLERLFQLGLLNATGPILVMGLEHCLPLVDASKQFLEFMDINCSCLVFIVHIDHHPTGFLAKVAPVTIY